MKNWRMIGDTIHKYKAQPISATYIAKLVTWAREIISMEDLLTKAGIIENMDEHLFKQKVQEWHEQTKRDLYEMLDSHMRDASKKRTL